MLPVTILDDRVAVQAMVEEMYPEWLILQFIMPASVHLKGDYEIKSVN